MKNKKFKEGKEHGNDQGGKPGHTGAGKGAFGGLGGVKGYPDVRVVTATPSTSSQASLPLSVTGKGKITLAVNAPNNNYGYFIQGLCVDGKAVGDEKGLLMCGFNMLQITFEKSISFNVVKANLSTETTYGYTCIVQLAN